jgi:hypothetical protein
MGVCALVGQIRDDINEHTEEELKVGKEVD